MQNARVLAPAQTDQLPPSWLQGAIMHRTNPGGRTIRNHKRNMGFTQVQAQKKMYGEWRNCRKDQMIAKGLAPVGRIAKGFSDANFLPIYTGMRTLCPACALIISTVVANDLHHREDIEGAVMELVNDSYRKLNETNNKGKRILPNAANPRGQVVVPAWLPQRGTPNLSWAATTIRNPCQLPSNPPPAHVQAGRQLRQAPPGAAGPNVPAGQVNVPAAGHRRQAPPDVAGPNIPAAQVNIPAARKLRHAPPGAAVPNGAAAGLLAQALPGAAVPNVPAARHLWPAPLGAAGSNVPAAQVNIPAAGQLGQPLKVDVSATGLHVHVQPCNDPAYPQMVRDSSSPDNDPAPAPRLPDPPENSPAAVENQPGARGFRPTPHCKLTGSSLPNS